MHRLRFVSALLATIAVAISPAAFADAPATRPAMRLSLSSQPRINALLGTPSNATTNVRNTDDYLLVKPYFVASYNSSKGTPNWVSWVLSDEDVGDAERKNSFDTDELPIGFVRIKSSEYVNSGFDRGHVCPHGDRAFSERMSFSTFVMTNIMPQAPSLNRKAWVQLEDFERELARQGNHLYIAAGPSGVGGVGSNGAAKSIGGRIVVPSHCWKIIVVVPAEGGLNDLRKVTAETRVIAVSMPNDDTKVDDEWKQYRVNVASIEKDTGLKFFSRVRPDVAKALKLKVDDGPTPPAIPKHYGE